MKVKVGDKIFDSGEQPLMVILNQDERDQIRDMPPEGTKYCQYPDEEEWTKDHFKKIKKWMEVED